MTRFDAATEADRRDLIVDAIAAHRDRESQFCTLETPIEDGEEVPPWVQFDAAESLLNVDCSDEEVTRLESLLDDFGGLTVAEKIAPEDGDGTNVRIRARVDDDRVAQFVDAVFRTVYGRPEDYRLWVTAI